MNSSVRYPMCPNDGFPLIDVDGAIVCSVERADALIGGQQVTNATNANGYLYLNFANGASMPLTCPCCGGRLHLRGLSHEQLGQMLAGRNVEGFRHGEWVGGDDAGQRHPIFAIQFSGQEDLSARTIQVGLDSVHCIQEDSSYRENGSELH